jgi:threonine/homoserine/homoserine lactone efflux protein
MMTLNLFLALSAFALVSSLTPGPNNLMLMASGTNFGFARTVPHMLGVSIGFVFMVIMVGVICALFLLFVGGEIFRHKVNALDKILLALSFAIAVFYNAMLIWIIEKIKISV